MGEEWRDLGGEPGKVYRVCLVVPGMGGLSATGIAQSVHEGVLKKGGAWDEADAVRYGKIVPRRPLWQFCYIDDFHV